MDTAGAECETEDGVYPSLRMSIPSSAPAHSRTTDFNLDCNVLRLAKCRLRPTPRSGHRIVVDEANLYSFGGYNPTHSLQETFGLFGEVWRFNLATHVWTRLSASGPLEAASHTMSLMQDSLIIFGGTGHPWGHRLSNSLHVFHVPTVSWSTLSCTGDLPSPRYGHTMNMCQGSLYVIGGTTGTEYNMNVHKLNLKSIHWKNISPQAGEGSGEPLYESSGPFARYRHEVVTQDEWILVLGGSVAEFIFDFVDIPAFNTMTRTWSRLKSQACRGWQCYPQPRKFHAVVQFEGYAYLCGGSTGQQQALDDIWRLELRSLQWQKMNVSLPQPVYFHAAAVTPAGCMYVFGGVLGQQYTDMRTNSVSKMWLVVPSLQEMVWDRLTARFHKALAEFAGHFQARTSTPFCIPPKLAKRLI